MSANGREVPAATAPAWPVLDRQHCQLLRENFQRRLAAGETELAFDRRETSDLRPSAI
ncbi:MAG: hypothetical protein M0Z90_05035 [Desulfobacteraceae bacterium]|nr:hypothetical protein [Desulfobacteraceae bacterium]